MKLLYPITILRSDTDDVVVGALAVVQDGFGASVFREIGEDNIDTPAEAERVVKKLIYILRYNLEIDVSPEDEQRAIDAANSPADWVEV